jgi:hypothetical protein
MAYGYHVRCHAGSNAVVEAEGCCALQRIAPSRLTIHCGRYSRQANRGFRPISRHQSELKMEAADGNVTLHFSIHLTIAKLSLLLSAQ